MYIDFHMGNLYCDKKVLVLLPSRILSEFLIIL